MRTENVRAEVEVYQSALKPFALIFGSTTSFQALDVDEVHHLLILGAPVGDVDQVCLGRVRCEVRDGVLRDLDDALLHLLRQRAASAEASCLVRGS
ncbi:MAG: hypothetical protein R3E48_03655 [Burkholderiaceae bacterium]